MLIQFKCKNFTSFKNETIFDMTAISAYKEHPYNLIATETDDEQYLKVAAIYGANASGKSNFIYAYKAFVEVVKKSFAGDARFDFDDEVTFLSRWYRPYAYCQEPVEFEGYFANDRYEFQYGFAFNSEQILAEWLLRKPKVKNGKKQTILKREAGEKIVLGEFAGAESKKYIDQIEDHVLVLSFLARLKMKDNVFQELMALISSAQILTAEKLAQQSRLLSERALSSRLLHCQESAKRWASFTEFINAIDVEIDSISVEDIAGNGRDLRVYAHHRTEDGEAVKFPISWESTGTLKAIHFYFAAEAAIASGGIIVADELDAAFHPLLLKFFVDLFEAQDNTAQLIYTAHDTTLLDIKYFRRDQIWFVDKNQYGVSDLYALSDFKIRRETSFEKDYLSGSFGAIPLLKNFELGGAAYGEQ